MSWIVHNALELLWKVYWKESLISRPINYWILEDLRYESTLLKNRSDTSGELRRSLSVGHCTSLETVLMEALSSQRHSSSTTPCGRNAYVLFNSQAYCVWNVICIPIKKKRKTKITVYLSVIKTVLHLSYFVYCRVRIWIDIWFHITTHRERILLRDFYHYVVILKICCCLTRKYHNTGHGFFGTMTDVYSKSLISQYVI